jgi:hypothetical protein
LLARGYLHAPDLTDDRFIELADRRWYRTGDMVERQENGELSYLGRLDEQVQVRGNRIEPGEIEAVLERHPTVAKAVVLAEDGSPEGPRLVAYIQAAGGRRDDLASHLSQLLPPVMHPSEHVWLDALPVTANGKVDRKALAGLARTDGPAVPSRAPADELEAAVGELVAELLGRSSVGPDENFLLIGGHSLLGAQIVTRLADEYGVEVSLRSLFDNPTPAGMAAEVRVLLIEQITGLDDEALAELAASDLR